MITIIITAFWLLNQRVWPILVTTNSQLAISLQNVLELMKLHLARLVLKLSLLWKSNALMSLFVHLRINYLIRGPTRH